MIEQNDNLSKLLEKSVSCGFSSNKLHVTYEDGSEKTFYFINGKWQE